MSDLEGAREAIDGSLEPAGPRGLGRVHRALRAVALRAGQAHARHQQEVDRRLLAMIEQLGHGHEVLRSWLHNTDARVERLDQATGALTSRLDALTTSPDRLDALRLERFDADGAGKVIGYRQAEGSVAPGEDYVAFEDVFRMSEAVIRERQRRYVALVNGHTPVLDVGCGRGEFLELLREAGIFARGVDLDEGMIARCRAKGLDVEQADALAYLERAEDDSLGTVFASQVVEHLSYEQLMQLLRLVHQKLAPDGILIAETVNPHSPAALKNFWIDLTHHHPIFPEVLLTLTRGVGFDSAYVFHPGGSGDVDADRDSCGDYAIVAVR